VEKKKPNYALPDVLAIVAASGVDAFTQTALHGAWDLGLSSGEAVAVVLGLRQTNFYKSMTTHTDHRIWQDVYHAELKSGLKVYIKLTLRENGNVVIQFKEK
jgi:motility quorum-sensing regulator/GCU-specific mRNA interferase toxin